MSDKQPPETERAKYRVVVFRMELTLKGEEAWKRMYDIRGPASSTRHALKAVAHIATNDPKADEPVPSPVAPKARVNRKPKATPAPEKAPPTKVRHPEIVVATGGLNEAAVISRVRKRMRDAGVPSEELREFVTAIRPNGMTKMPERPEVMRIVRQWITVKGAKTNAK